MNWASTYITIPLIIRYRQRNGVQVHSQALNANKALCEREPFLMKPVRLSVDNEQDACNDRANSRDQLYRQAAELYADQEQSIQDQENTEQSPFQSAHFNAPFDEELWDCKHVCKPWRLANVQLWIVLVMSAPGN
jgi:hypothetical protein